jgi:hypothetical protein
LDEERVMDDWGTVYLRSPHGPVASGHPLKEVSDLHGYRPRPRNGRICCCWTLPESDSRAESPFSGLCGEHLCAAGAWQGCRISWSR